MKWPKQSFALALSSSLVLATAQTGCANAEAQSTPAPTLQMLDVSTVELDQLVAPIALYPDNLVAQILAASTWPGEVVEADRWMQQHSGLSETALARSVDRQKWDPSVKALTQFPLILANMDRNLSWSSALGNAWSIEPQGVLDAVQVMRRRAQRAGHLQGNPQEIVTTEGDTIIIQPADAETVYVPEYDPWLVYGAPIPTYPDWYGEPGLFVTDPDVLFGQGTLIGTLVGFGWGWHLWGTDWHGRGVVWNHSPYSWHDHYIASQSAFPGAHTAFAPHSGFHTGGLHGLFGAGNRGFGGFNHVGIGGGLRARGGLGFGGGFHIAAGGFHGGGFHGGGGGHR